MTFSLNEIEAMGKRAARGAGLAWGLAEEAGKAARWLSARGLPGPQALAALLTRNDGKAYEDVAPGSAAGEWRAPSGHLCPLASGAALCDRARAIAAGLAIELGPTAQPLLLAPYAAAAARLSGVPIELSWDRVTIRFTADRLSVDGDRGALTARRAERVRCRRATGHEFASAAGAFELAALDAETWSRLEAFAQRTLAPATDASRAAGAGAGLTDND